jgi:hypothetical protein
MFLDEDIAALIDVVEEAESILRRNEMDGWAGWLCNDAKGLRNGNGDSVRHLLSAFGGMGSVNDVVLAKTDPDRPSKPMVSTDNDRLSFLISEIHRLTLQSLGTAPRNCNDLEH